MSLMLHDSSGRRQSIKEEERERFYNNRIPSYQNLVQNMYNGGSGVSTLMLHPNNGREQPNDNRMYIQEDILHPNIYCDHCHQYIINGIRYKCTICEDFDFCEDCESKDFIREMHYNDKHIFMKIRSSIFQINRSDIPMNRPNLFNGPEIRLGCKPRVIEASSSH